MKYFWIVLIRIYQYTLSPLLGMRCRYYPTCSHYMIQAIQKWGALKGIYLGIKRIIRCSFWSAGGYDPVEKSCNEYSEEDCSGEFPEKPAEE
ncbi:MAG: membrane protein insertion efficiency factor YidD [Chlamydiota bacterium]